MKGSIVWIIVLAVTSAAAYGQSFRLAGRVMGEDAPLPGATVSLGDRHTHTDIGGNFLFERLPAGLYMITVSYVGYHTLSRQVELTNATGQLTDIHLQKDTAMLKEVIIHHHAVAERNIVQAQPVEVVGREYLHRHLGGSLMQSLEKLPGVKNIGIGTGQSKPLIRGLGFNQVVVVDNGIKHEGQQWGADHGLEIDQYAAEQVEIIKGPASFLYGADAIAGAILVKPPSPPSKYSFGGRLDITANSNSTGWAGSARVFARRDKWFIATQLTLSEYDDFKVPTDTVFVYSYAVPLHHRRVRNTAGYERNVHIHTGWIGNRIESVFYASRIFTKAGFFANAHGLEPRRVDHSQHDRSAHDILLPSQEVTHYKLINKTLFRINRHRLEWQTGYQQNFRQERNQYVNHGYMPPVFPQHTTMSPTLERQYDKTVLSTTIKDQWHQNQHHFTIGGNAEYQQNRIDGWGFLIPAFNQTQAGLFIHDKITLSDRLSLLSALRYDYGHIRMHRYADWFTTPVVNGSDTLFQHLVRSQDTTRKFSSVNFSVGMNYNAGAFSLRANLGSSFRMPIAKELGANGVNYHYFRYEKGDIRLSPERSYQLDLGLSRTTPKWFIELSPYLNYFPNYIYLNPTATHDYYYGAGNQVFQYTQSRVLRYGAELQTHYQFVPDWTARLNAEYLYNEQLSGSKKGYTLPFTPPPSALLSINYEIPQGQGFSGTYFSAEWRLTAAQNNIVPPERTTPAYQVLGLTTGTSLPLGKQPLEIRLQVRNLLNTRYLSHTSFYRLIELPEAGRNIVLSLSLPFISHNDKATSSNTITQKHRQ